eukprot:GHVT01040688.1.p1 GENE.GHVT01040688.1~~GHVT01040688.1.p1  ORF type:complete len:256 (+),score=27.00 GHVT01040688.1:2441-3208(+)
MSVEEAARVLQLSSERPATPAAVRERATRLYALNAPQEGKFIGSPYLQQKVEAARKIMLDHLGAADQPEEKSTDGETTADTKPQDRQHTTNTDAKSDKDTKNATDDQSQKPRARTGPSAQNPNNKHQAVANYQENLQTAGKIRPSVQTLWAPFAFSLARYAGRGNLGVLNPLDESTGGAAETPVGARPIECFPNRNLYWMRPAQGPLQQRQVEQTHPAPFWTSPWRPSPNWTANRLPELLLTTASWLGASERLAV